MMQVQGAAWGSLLAEGPTAVRETRWRNRDPWSPRLHGRRWCLGVSTPSGLPWELLALMR